MIANDLTSNGDEEHGNDAGIAKIETMTHVGEQRLPAVVIWFDENRSLRYVWDEDQGAVRRQTCFNGAVQVDDAVGGCREEMLAYGLEAVSEYINVYRHDKDALAENRPDLYTLLTANPNAD